jgi:hypothetical protein
VLVCPLEQRIIIDTLVFRTPAWTCVRFSLETRVARAEDGLAEIVETVSRVVRYLLCQIVAVERSLIVLYDV